MEVTRYSWSAVRTLAEKQPSVYTSLVRSGLLVDGKLVLIEDVSNDHGKRRLVLGNGRVVGVSSVTGLMMVSPPSAMLHWRVSLSDRSDRPLQTAALATLAVHVGAALAGHLAVMRAVDL